MTTLHIIPEAGLANRLRALGSALWIADTRAVPLVLTWPDDFAISVPFEAIFENQLDRDAGRLAGAPTVTVTDPRSIELPPGEPPHLRRVVEIRSSESFSLTDGPPPYSRAFWSAIRPYLISLIPVAEVQQRVDEVSGCFGVTTLGVHVRSGAGPVSFSQADRINVERFFEEIDRVLRVETAAKIFLATDADIVIERFEERYGSIVMTSGDDATAVVRGTADNVVGLRMALVDLLLLSRTNLLLGSFFSSFSTVAAVIGAIPLMRLGGKPGEPGGESDYEFLVDRPLLTRAAWRLRRRRYSAGR